MRLVVGVIGGGVVVVLAWRVRMVVDRVGVTLCDGLHTRRLGWDEIPSSALAPEPSRQRAHSRTSP